MRMWNNDNDYTVDSIAFVNNRDEGAIRRKKRKKMGTDVQIDKPERPPKRGGPRKYKNKPVRAHYFSTPMKPLLKFSPL